MPGKRPNDDVIKRLRVGRLMIYIVVTSLEGCLLIGTVHGMPFITLASNHQFKQQSNQLNAIRLHVYETKLIEMVQISIFSGNPLGKGRP